MEILVITRSAINRNDNMGNTIDNIFRGKKNINVHNIYMRAEQYKNDLCKTVYQISEQDLIKNPFSRIECGFEITDNTKISNKQENDEKICYDVAKKLNLYSLWYFRELLWGLGNWRNKSLEDYIKRINPDVIFMPSFGCWYPYKVLFYILGIKQTRVILFHADDNYSMKQFRLSPLFWTYRLNLRRWIRKAVKISDINFCISELQKKEYDKALNIDSLILRKTPKISFNKYNKIEEGKTVQIVYTGNISSGRWKTIALVGKAIDKMNSQKLKAQINIYTASTISKKIDSVFKSIKCLKLLGPVPASEIPSIQSNADILLHAESFSLKDKLEVRLSFSTKIIDYMQSGKCILAVGPHDIASIDYFVSNNIPYCITNRLDIKTKVENLVMDKELIKCCSKQVMMITNDVVKKQCITDITKVL